MINKNKSNNKENKNKKKKKNKNLESQKTQNKIENVCLAWMDRTLLTAIQQNNCNIRLITVYFLCCFHFWFKGAGMARQIHAQPTGSNKQFYLNGRYEI